MKAGDVVIRFGHSDHWRGQLLERVARRTWRVEWPDGNTTIEREWQAPLGESGLMRVVGAVFKRRKEPR